jgi:hypothetical protein
MEKGIVVRIRDHDDVAAASAVPTTWTAAGHEFLPPESQTAVSAVSSSHRNHNFIDKHSEKT